LEKYPKKGANLLIKSLYFMSYQIFFVGRVRRRKDQKKIKASKLNSKFLGGCFKTGKCPLTIRLK
jgi:hypothetical protein